MKRETHTIDATDRPLGRLATQAAVLLRGKQKKDFVPYKDMGDFVVVKNAEKIKLTGKKLEQKIYHHYSGYLGGMKEIPMKKLFKERPSEVIRKAVFGMLPNTKLRTGQMKRLKIE